MGDTGKGKDEKKKRKRKKKKEEEEEEELEVVTSAFNIEPGLCMQKFRELGLSVLLIMSSVYFMIVPYLMFPGLEGCEETTGIWIHWQFVSGIMAYAGVYGVRCCVKNGNISADRDGKLAFYAFFAPGSLCLLLWLGCQAYYVSWWNTAEGEEVKAAATDSCLEFYQTSFASLVVVMVFSFGVLPLVVYVHWYSMRNCREWAETPYYFGVDPDKPDAPDARQVLVATAQGTKLMLVQPERGLSRRERKELEMNVLKKGAAFADQAMLKMFYNKDMSDPDRGLSLREMRQIRNAASDKEFRASAAAWLEMDRLKEEAKQLRERMLQEKSDKRRGVLANKLSKVTKASSKLEDAVGPRPTLGGDSKLEPIEEGGIKQHSDALKKKKVKQVRSSRALSAIDTGASKRMKDGMAFSLPSTPNGRGSSKVAPIATEQLSPGAVEMIASAGGTPTVSSGAKWARKSIRVQSFSRGGSAKDKSWRQTAMYNDVQF